MRRRSHRQNLVAWSSSDRPGDPFRARWPQPVSPRRVRRLLRAGAVLAVVGLRRLARLARARWRPGLLLAGGVMTVVGVILSSGVVLIPGIVILLFALLKETGAPACQAAAQLAQARWRG